MNIDKISYWVGYLAGCGTVGHYMAYAWDSMPVPMLLLLTGLATIGWCAVWSEYIHPWLSGG